ncbi:hypothetical protein IC235_14000 [Hymenobacter sp. BT664]|uniref:HEAT repeat domain-containing protein n=1 Tax=Hymenobacter montanus TaxID=2771359 RepID=A0A927GKC8_9BACT|nr:DUF6493 family protein [Hymenobacter montanus]MBD2769001.1 hypothetical protein [Hymenobacter montanus]
MTVVDKFEQLVRHSSLDELLPFLLELEKKDLIPVRLKTKQLYKERDEWDSNQARQLHQQEPHLFLAGLTTYSRQEALTRTFRFPHRFYYSHKALLMQVLEHYRPAWLTDWLQSLARRNMGWHGFDYHLLRGLADAGLVSYDPWLFSQLLADCLNHHNQTFEERGQSFEAHVLKQFQADATLLERDVPLLFDFDTPVDTASGYVNKNRPAITWLTLLPQLVASGHLDRNDLLTRSLLALRRDFRRPLLTWFKSLVLALNPTAAECLARQTELIELLAHPLPLVVNFALDQLKDLWAEADLQAATLLLYADGLMTRPDLKTGLRTLLGGFSKLLKAHPSQAPVVARLYAAALSHADAAVQERAAKGLAEVLNAREPLLAATETSEIVDALPLYADLLAPAARTTLAPWLGNPDERPGATHAAYAPSLDFSPDISAATAIAPVADWHELLFLTGQVLQHDDPKALERWLAGLLRLRPLFPADCNEPLQPYVLQILPYLKGKTEAEVAAIIKRPHLANGYVGLVQALTLGWANGFVTPLVKSVLLRTNYQTADPLVALEQRRLLFVEQLLRDQQTLPLLSTPSHAPHWVAPTVLVQRLLAYQAAEQEPNAVDLTLALARTAHQHPATTAAAQALLPQLRHTGLRELLQWLLSAAGTPLPQGIASHHRPVGWKVWIKSLRQQFTEPLGQGLPAAVATPSTLAEALPGLWVVAARTRMPAAEFPELANLTANDCPGVVRSWQPRWELQRKSNTYVDKWKAGSPEVTEYWTELRLLCEPADAVLPDCLLLYSLHTTFKRNEQYQIWRHIGSLSADYPFLVALLPHYPGPLYWHTLRLAATHDTVDSTTRDPLVQALRSLLGSGPCFDEPATLLLAVGLTHNASLCRALALEVLLAAVEQRRVETSTLGKVLGQLLAAEFVPVQRLADGLAQARAISPVTDDALRQTLDALLPQLPAEPPRNTRKLLEAYADVLGRTHQPVPETVKARLHEWQASASLKKAAALLAKPKI